MRLSTRTRYGTRILLDLAIHHNDKTILREVTHRQQVSHSYLEHAIAPLTRAGIIGTQRGTGGGIWIAKPLNQIKLGEVVRLLEGENILMECINRPEYCPRTKTCASRKVWQRLEQVIFNVLDKTTLQDLLDEQIEAESCRKDFYCGSR